MFIVEYIHCGMDTWVLIVKFFLQLFCMFENFHNKMRGKRQCKLTACNHV